MTRRITMLVIAAMVAPGAAQAFAHDEYIRVSTGGIGRTTPIGK